MFFLAILITLLAYLLGSLSSALIVSKKLDLPDPRTYGSGNPGSSNVLRSGRKDAAAWTLLGDALKGFLVVALAYLICAVFDGMPMTLVPVVAVAVVIGHMYPIFFDFKGGKGVATALGVMLAMSFWTTFWTLLIWCAVAYRSKKSSLASLVAAFCAPWIAFIVLRHDVIGSEIGQCILFIAILVIYRHRDNIQRILRKEEWSFGTPSNATNANNTNTEQTTSDKEEAAVLSDAVDNVKAAQEAVLK